MDPGGPAAAVWPVGRARHRDGEESSRPHAPLLAHYPLHPHDALAVPISALPPRFQDGFLPLLPNIRVHRCSSVVKPPLRLFAPLLLIPLPHSLFRMFSVIGGQPPSRGISWSNSTHFFLSSISACVTLLRVNRTAGRCGLTGKDRVSRGRCPWRSAGGARRSGCVAASKLALVLSR